MQLDSEIEARHFILVFFMGNEGLWESRNRKFQAYEEEPMKPNAQNTY